MHEANVPLYVNTALHKANISLYYANIFFFVTWYQYISTFYQHLISLNGTPKTELNPKTNVTAFATKFVLTLSKLLNNNVTNNWALEYINCNIGALSSCVDLLDCRGPRDVNYRGPRDAHPQDSLGPCDAPQLIL